MAQPFTSVSCPCAAIVCVQVFWAVYIPAVAELVAKEGAFNMGFENLENFERPLDEIGRNSGTVPPSKNPYAQYDSVAPEFSPLMDYSDPDCSESSPLMGSHTRVFIKRPQRNTPSKDGRVNHPHINGRT